MFNQKKYQKEWYLKNKDRWIGYRQKSKEKRKEYNKKWAERNPEKVKKSALKYYYNNLEEQRKKARIRRVKYYWENKEKCSTRNKIYKKENRRKINIYQKERYQNNPKFKINSNISNAIREALKKRKAGRRWETLVGYTLQDLMKHLEVQFDDNMFWENYGSYWWVDHIKPQSLFHYIYPEDPGFQECWALKNLQPMEKIANIIKSNKYEPINA